MKQTTQTRLPSSMAQAAPVEKKNVELRFLKGIVHTECAGPLLYEERQAHPGSEVKPSWLTCVRCQRSLGFNVDLELVQKDPEFYGVMATGI